MRTAPHLLLFVALVCGSAAAVRARSSEPRIRVGTYDNRAIAVAYAPSRFNPVAEKMKEHATAKQAGDSAEAVRVMDTATRVAQASRTASWFGLNEKPAALPSGNDSAQKTAVPLGNTP